MEFTHEQKREIYEQGYVKLSGVIPQIMIDEALQAINHSIGEGMDPKEMPKFRAQSFCPDVKNETVISDLVNRTPVMTLAESLLGEGNLREIRGGQIAVRFPTLHDPPPAPRPHLDGMYSPNNGVPEGTIQNFTMLVGVYLSEVQRTYAGNFTVWPGTHRIYEEYFRTHGAESLLNGMPPVDLPEPLQVQVKPGDVVFSHYQVAHGVAANVSPHPRYALYFRLRHVRHADDWKARMTDIWLDWPGMESVVRPRAIKH